MKITIIHGENSSASLNFLKSILDGFKKKGVVISRISKELPINITEALTQGELFNEESLFLLEEPDKLSANEVLWISRNAKSLKGVFLIYHDSELPALFLNKLSDVSEVRLFKLPQSLFTFLDSFQPRGAGRCIKLYHELLQKEAPEFLFAVFCKHVRDLYWARVNPESLTYPAWRVSKLRRQASAFSEEKLKKTLNSLARIDYSSKTSSHDLGSSLDLLIAGQLQ